MDRLWKNLRQINHIRRILPGVVAFLTGHSRYLPKLEWSSQSLIFNLFRIYEQIFFRRFGIRIESMVDAGITDQVYSELRYFYTVESVLVHLEIALYSWLRGFSRFKVVKVYLPVLAPTNFGYFNDPKERPYLFAIAFGAITSGQNSLTTQSFSVTTSGSDRCLVSGIYDQGGQSTESGGGAGNVTSATYNSVAMAESQTGIGSASNSNGAVHLFILGNPATGANTYAMTRNTSRGDILDFRANVANYSGCSATGQPDSHAAVSQATATPMNLTTTVVLPNCWLVGYANNNGGAQNVGTGTTVRLSAANRYGDSNGTVGTGSQSLQWTWTDGAGIYDYGIVYSIAPVSVARTSDFFLFF